VNQTEPQRLDNGNEPRAAGPNNPLKNRRDFWWKAVIALAVLGAIVATVLIKSSRKDPLQEPAPGAERAEFPPKEILATVNGAPITLAEVESQFQGLPERFRSQFRAQKDAFLEEIIARKLLVQEAERLKIGESDAYKQALSEHSAHAGHEEETLMNALLETQVFGRIRVSEEELRVFYEEQKADMPAGVAFDAIKESLRNSVIQQKRYEAVEKYISGLKQKAVITRNEEWIEAQKALTADNPLDKALSTGRPVVADLGRGTCIPCKMMKPILEDLAKEYKGKAEILIIDVGEYPLLARRCRVRVIPTQIFYDASGNEVYRHEGFMPREEIRDELAKLGVN